MSAEQHLEEAKMDICTAQAQSVDADGCGSADRTSALQIEHQHVLLAIKHLQMAERKIERALFEPA